MTYKIKLKFNRNNFKAVYSGTETLTFLEARIWEIVPDYIKKVTDLKNLDLKSNYEIQKTIHAGYAKGSYQNLIFYRMP